ncbi:MAG: LPS export ABC transporter permease LptF [Thermoanaerobaculia bacterium]|jgi:LPS export ABC transporter permease LptF/LPS export ABC transporter permease LptG
MRILSRYIVKEIIGPTFLGFCFYTFVILMNTLFRMAEMIIRRSLPVSTVLELLLLSLPHIVVLTIPMALLFGVLIAVGRLSSDSEIIAMRSVGVSTRVIYRPVFYVSFAIFVINLFVTNYVTPWGNKALRSLQAEIFSSSVEREIRPRVFYDEYPNRVIYVNDVAPNGEWSGVFISDTTVPDRQQIIVAKSGRLTSTPGTRQVWVELHDAENHFYSSKNPAKYDRVRNSTQRILLPDMYSGPQKPISTDRKSMSVIELFEEADRIKRDVSPKFADEELRLVHVEIHKKISIPFACLAFGLVALPLGITNKRGGKSSGFTLSIGVILVYYLLLSNGEEMARTGQVPPWLGMWLPNVVLLVLGLFLLRKVSRDAGASSGPGRVVVWLQTLFDRLHIHLRARRILGSDDEDGGILSRLDIRFPNIIDRYVLRHFIQTVFFIVLSVVVLQMIVDYSEMAGDISENNVPVEIVAEYYRNLTLVVLDKTIPISILAGTLICFGLLSRTSEVTAMKATGVSLYRMAVPVIVVATLASIFSYFLLDFVLPYNNEKVASLKSQIKGKPMRRSVSWQQRQWVFGKGRYLFNFLSYDKNAKALAQVQVLEFDPVEMRITRRVFAEEARFDGSGWVFVNGWVRSFDDHGGASYTPIDSPVRLHYPERPEYFTSDFKLPNQMTYAELRRYIRDLEISGYSSEELRVQLYQKTAWPFVSLVMALIALPFSFRIGKQGALYGIGVALFLAFVYWAVYGIFTKFGEVGNLPALLSAWSANVLFIIAAVYLFVHVET